MTALRPLLLQLTYCWVRTDNIMSADFNVNQSFKLNGR